MLVFMLVINPAFLPSAWGQSTRMQMRNEMGTGLDMGGRGFNTSRSFGSVKNGGLRDNANNLDNSSSMAAMALAGGGGGVSQLSYSVHVLGEVLNPGTYRALPSDRVTDLLRYAGNITLQGSQRNIQLRRQGSVKKIDMFDYKYYGHLDDNPYIIDNDVIFVPLKKGEYEIEGPVNRPGNYELAGSISLAQAVTSAGGYTTGRSLEQNLRVIRFDGSKKLILEVQNDKASQERFTLLRGDIIVVPHILTDDKKFDYSVNRIPGDNIFYPTVDANVYVVGAVLTPGPLDFEPSFNYRQYVNMAGPTADAKRGHIKIVRSNGRKLMAKEDTVINPGDTLIVYQKYWKPETVVSWLSSLTSLTLSTLVITDRFK